MREAQYGDRVKVHIESRLRDGTTIETTFNKAPIEITVGADDLVPVLEDSIVGMGEGDNKELTLGAKEAFGHRHKELEFEFKKSDIPDSARVSRGNILNLPLENGQRIPLRVIDITKDSVRMDGNHPLAGKDIECKIELVQVN